MKTGFNILLIFTALILQGCYPMDDASARAPKPGQNRCFNSSRYPQYILVYYLITESKYRLENEARYFKEALTQLKANDGFSFDKGGIGQERYALVVTTDQSKFHAAGIIEIKDLFDLSKTIESIVASASIEHNPDLFKGADEECVMLREDISKRKQRGEQVIEKPNWRDENLSKEDREFIKKLQENNK
jgi:hypothetical protein